MRSFSPDSVTRSLSRSRGAVTIEFALLFMIFFALFYAIVTYSLVFLLQTSFNHAASEGARSAISIDPQYFSNNNSYIEQGVSPLVRQTVGDALAWLPSGVREIVLGEGNSNVQVVYADNVLTVRVVYGNYAGNPLIPLLVIPGIGPVFSPAQDIQGTASIRLV
jgi:Flp pilus assembly protein TadG